MEDQYDYVVIGSGFGGSVSALRLSEKGYKVLVIEKGKWFKSEDFPKTNWNLRKWMWEPFLGFYGFFRMTFLNHVTVVSGVGVGGGSLTYANTLPIPKSDFFNSGSWKDLLDWESALSSYYKLAYKMLGAENNPKFFDADKAVLDIARKMGKESDYTPSKVAVYFGQPEVEVPDPYFGGKGPTRTGCKFCGACMTGCRHNAKNTLDKNYLLLAQLHGAEILAKHKVQDVIPINSTDGSDGYRIRFRASIGRGRALKEVKAKGIVFSGGVVGTIPLLLKLKESSLPNLSQMVGRQVRTNNEALIFVTSTNNNKKDFSKGIAIGSVLHTDKHSHLEPTRYGTGSGFFRTMMLPLSHHKSVLRRLAAIFVHLYKHPVKVLKTVFTRDYSSRTTILLFMQTLDSTLQIARGKRTTMKTLKENGPVPTSFIPHAKELADKYAEEVDGIPFASFTEILNGTPTTAHILGGAVMGENINNGVINERNEVFGYKNMYVCDGSMISANPGVNPALSITAISEHAMSKIQSKASLK